MHPDDHEHAHASPRQGVDAHVHFGMPRHNAWFRKGESHVSIGRAAVIVSKSSRLLEDPGRDSTWAFLVVSDENPLRTAWNAWLVVLLAYTGIVLPFKLAFMEYGIPSKTFPLWFRSVEFCLVDISFYIDLLINFFFTYRDSRDRQVWDLRMIAVKYLKTHFLLNFIACIPSQAFSHVLCNYGGLKSCADSNINQLGRWTRLQRVSRMARLARMSRLGKCMGDCTPWEHLKGMRGIRVVNKCFGLLFVVHVMACGWWICANLHANPRDTWIHRRQLGENGESVYELSEEGEYGAMQQWTTSMYFTLTIFTTVGFGDMSAFTVGEMWYACFAMVMGCVTNGIILSEVITILTTANEADLQREQTRRLMKSFGRHMQVSKALTEELAKWATMARIDNSHAYNHEAVKDVLMSGVLPRRLFNMLPQALFNGQLVRNRFVCGSLYLGHHIKMPARFPIMLALACQGYYYERDQTVYYVQDHAWNIYLVMAGVFSYITGSFTTPQELDTINLAQGLFNLKELTISQGEDDASPYQLFSPGSYFGDLEIVVDSGPRVATARCESFDGATLALHKRDLFSLIEEFPHITTQWRQAARRRERHRKKLMARFHRGSYKDLAARMLQRGWRHFLAKRKGIVASDVEKYRAMVGRMRETVSKKSRPIPPSEHVPQYARLIQAQIQSVRTDVDELRDHLSDEVKEMKQMIRDLGTTGGVTTMWV